MTWQYEKFKDDGAIYAICPQCNFRHNPSRFDAATMQSRVVYQYLYCPMCGAYLYDAKAETDGIEVKWNEHSLFEEQDIPK